MDYNDILTPSLLPRAIINSKWVLAHIATTTSNGGETLKLQLLPLVMCCNALTISLHSLETHNVKHGVEACKKKKKSNLNVSNCCLVHFMATLPVDNSINSRTMMGSISSISCSIES